MPFTPSPRADTNRALIAKYQAGDTAAGDALVKLNAGLAKSIALRYLPGAGSLDMEDLLQEGRLGLLTAARKFDLARGCLFSTYATHWIRQGIRRAVDNGCSTIRVPVHQRVLAGRVASAQEHLRTCLGREPTVQEVAAAAGIRPWHIECLLRLPEQPESLDQPVNEEGARLGDLIASEESVEAQVVEGDPGESLFGVPARDLLARVKLSERERFVVEMRYGFATGEPETLKKTAFAAGMSNEGCRHAQVRAVEKLRKVALAGER